MSASRCRASAGVLFALIACLLPSCHCARTRRVAKRTADDPFATSTQSFSSSSNVTIFLAWNHWLGDEFFKPQYRFASDDGSSLTCSFTSDAAMADKADAVWFHLATGPERGPFQGKYKPRSTQLGIEFTWESYPMQLCRFGPHMLEPSVRQNYDLHVTYRRDADVWMPYYINAFKDYWNAHPPVPFERKRDAVVGVHSNCDGNCFVRNAYIERFLVPREPDDMKPVPPTVFRDDIVSGIVQVTDLPFHFYGKCMSNQPGWLPRDRDPKIHFADRNKLKMFRKYKFCETFENSADKDYVTEKVYIGLMAGCLPIYFGAPNVEDYVPTPESIINVRNYRNREELAAAIHALADNKTAYDERMAWRRRDPSTWSPGFQRMMQYVGDEAGYHQHNVRLCKKVHEKLASKVKMSAMDVTKTV